MVDSLVELHLAVGKTDLVRGRRGPNHLLTEACGVQAHNVFCRRRGTSNSCKSNKFLIAIKINGFKKVQNAIVDAQLSRFVQFFPRAYATLRQGAGNIRRVRRRACSVAQ